VTFWERFVPQLMRAHAPLSPNTGIFQGTLSTVWYTFYVWHAYKQTDQSLGRHCQTDYIGFCSMAPLQTSNAARHLTYIIYEMDLKKKNNNNTSKQSQLSCGRCSTEYSYSLCTNNQTQRLKGLMDKKTVVCLKCLTVVRCHSPAAWKLQVRTKGNWRYQTHWSVLDSAGWCFAALVSGSAAPRWRRPPVSETVAHLPPRSPRRATRMGWIDWRERGRRWRQCRQTQCTSRSHKPAGPGMKTRQVWTWWVS